MSNGELPNVPGVRTVRGGATLPNDYVTDWEHVPGDLRSYVSLWGPMRGGYRVLIGRAILSGDTWEAWAFTGVSGGCAVASRLVSECGPGAVEEWLYRNVA